MDRLPKYLYLCFVRQRCNTAPSAAFILQYFLFHCNL